MSRPSIPRVMALPRLVALAAAALSATACQAPWARDDAPNAQLARAQALPPVSSGQRLGPDGYPLVGALPRSAARQLSDAEVAAQERRLAQAARRTGSGGASEAAYRANIERLRRLRDAQTAEVSAALAAEPAGRRPNAAAAQ